MKIRKRNRLEEYDYHHPCLYFITICVNQKNHVLSKIKNDEVHLNRIGIIVEQQWQWLSNQYTYIELDEYVIMPNHFHGIIILEFEPYLSKNVQIKSISGLIGAFKARSSKFAHEEGFYNFRWQRSFYDRIIRNERELKNIREYILNNPLQWELDIEYRKAVSEIERSKYYSSLFLE